VRSSDREWTCRPKKSEPPAYSDRAEGIVGTPGVNNNASRWPAAKSFERSPFPTSARPAVRPDEVCSHGLSPHFWHRLQMPKLPPES
jgi:hypothetical protein